MTKTESEETSTLGNTEQREFGDSHYKPLSVQQQLLDDETRALQVIHIGFLMSLCQTYFIICFAFV